MPQLLKAKEQVGRSGSLFASIKVRQWLVLAAVEAGRLRLAYEESLAALGLIEQMAGYALLKGYFEIVLAQVWYQWNRLEEARKLLQTVCMTPPPGGSSICSGGDTQTCCGSRSPEVIGPRRCRRCRRWNSWCGASTMGAMQAGCHDASAMVAGARTAQGGVRLGSACHLSARCRGTESAYGAFPVVMRVYFAEHRFPEALDLLERWRGHLDRPANIAITITYLAQYLVALYQTGKSEQACELLRGCLL